MSAGTAGGVNGVGLGIANVDSVWVTLRAVAVTAVLSPPSSLPSDFLCARLATRGGTAAWLSPRVARLGLGLWLRLVSGAACGRPCQAGEQLVFNYNDAFEGEEEWFKKLFPLHLAEEYPDHSLWE